MNHWFRILFAGASLAATMVAGAMAPAADWPEFRGPTSSGYTHDASPPTHWSEGEKGENIAWKVELPGRGPSSPIVIGNKVIVTCSSGITQNRLHVICFDVATGKQNWERQFWATGRTLSHASSANAAPTPASDGKLIFAFYSSNDLVCLDLDGNLKWFRGLAYDFPAAGNDVGMASSPTIAGNLVIVQIGCQGESFACGIDKTSGETKWRADQPHDASWCSPAPIRGAKPQYDLVLIQAPTQLIAYQAMTGKQSWAYRAACDGISSPAVSDGVVYVVSKGVTALNPSTTGEPTMKWNVAGLQPGAASPVVHDGRLYAINRAGVLTFAKATDGSALWKVRLQGEFWGTPALVDNKLYCISQNGAGQVVQASADGKRGEIIGKGQLDGVIQCSPAVSAGALYVRSDRHLWKIAASNNIAKRP